MIVLLKLIGRTKTAKVLLNVQNGFDFDFTAYSVGFYTLSLLPICPAHKTVMQAYRVSGTL